VKNGRGVAQECCVSPILFKFYNEYLTMESHEGFGDFKTEQVIYTVKYVDDIVLMATD
jgi:hypothetical protein